MSQELAPLPPEIEEEESQFGDIVTRFSEDADTAAVKQKQLISERKARAFIRILRETGRVKFAAEEAGWGSTSAAFARRAMDPIFKRAWDEAVQYASDILEDEAVRRAVEGVRKPVYYKGRVVDYQLEYSDGLLQFLLKGAKKKKYADRSEVKSDGGNHGIAVLPMVIDPEVWQQASKLVHEQQEKLQEKIIDAEYTEL